MKSCTTGELACDVLQSGKGRVVVVVVVVVVVHDLLDIRQSVVQWIGWNRGLFYNGCA